jgi:hypothetical protein
MISKEGEMHSFRFPALFLALCLLAACKPSPAAIQTSIAQTATQDALLNPTDTLTPSPTKTPYPTLTPSLTRSLTPTHLPPGTRTALAVQQMRTLTAGYYATRQAATATQSARMAAYQDIYWQELISYADQHIGEKIKVRIRVFNIVSTAELQGYIAGTYDAIYVVMGKDFSGIYEDDSITVYGIVVGNYCFENTYGSQICQPQLNHAFYTKP